MTRIVVLLGLLGIVATSVSCVSRSRAPYAGPIVDAHLHAFPPWKDDADWYPKDLPMPSSSDALRDRSLEELRRHHIVKAVTSGNLVAGWREAAPGLIVPGILLGSNVTPEVLRAEITAGRVAVIGETTFQYEGLPPDDARLEPYYALAEELDVPMSMHLGIGPPGGFAHYSVAAGRPLHLEPVLRKHPKLRLCVAHAGWPLLDEMVAVLYAFPNVVVDLGVIDWYVPRAEFHAYLRRLVDAGFGERILFGSDQMVWPDAIGRAIDAVDSADFLSDAQRRAVFHDNAVRFFRLKE